MVVLAPEHTWVYDDAEWRGAIVVVEHGQIELECLDEAAIPFAPFRRLNMCQFDLIAWGRWPQTKQAMKLRG
jgi:hypothetical protein